MYVFLSFSRLVRNSSTLWLLVVVSISRTGKRTGKSTIYPTRCRHVVDASTFAQNGSVSLSSGSLELSISCLISLCAFCYFFLLMCCFCQLGKNPFSNQIYNNFPNPFI